jgi:HK97 gp10 family phage protein
VTDAVHVEVEGAESLASTLHGAADDIAETTDALDDAGRVVVQRARGLVRVDTGALARSIVASRTGVEVTVSASEPYARFQEFGTVYVSAQPFLIPALDNSTPVVVDLLQRDVDRALGKVKGA